VVSSSVSIPGWKKTSLEDDPRFSRWATIPVYTLAGGFMVEFVAPFLPDNWHECAYIIGAFLGAGIGVAILRKQPEFSSPKDQQ
jgi:hypothetical protein